MPIRYRCRRCRLLLSITRRKIGEEVPCPSCGTYTRIPEHDVDDSPAEAVAEVPPAAESPAAERLPPAPVPTGAAQDVAFQPALGDRKPVPARSVPDVPQRPATVASESASQLSSSRVAITEEEADTLPFRRVQSDFEEMDLTPMVDVTFLLLIFFMVTASFSLQKSIEFPNPQDDQQGAAQTIPLLEDFKDESVMVEVDSQNAVYVDDELLPDAGQLAEQLALKMRSEGKVELLLTADDAARHEIVVQVIDAANAAGMQRIRMASRK